MTLQAVTEQNATEYETYKFITEASTLGIPVGECPNQLQTTLGNKRALLYTGVGVDGELRYQQSLGCIQLTVAND